MRRNSSLTVKTEEGIEPVQSSGFVVRGKPEELPAPQAQALLIQELEVTFDADLRLAMLQRLVQAQGEIKAIADKEESLAKTIELGRLAAASKAKERGIQMARAEFAKKMEQQRKSQQKNFMEVELPKLLEATYFLPLEDRKVTLESFASPLQVKLTWEQVNDELRCIPSIA